MTPATHPCTVEDACLMMSLCRWCGQVIQCPTTAMPFWCDGDKRLAAFCGNNPGGRRHEPCSEPPTVGNA